MQKIMVMCYGNPGYNKYYRTFTEFKTAIDDCLAKLETDYKNDVMSMMTLNFQTFEKDNVLAL
jgi:hypothetical protein